MSGRGDESGPLPSAVTEGDPQWRRPGRRRGEPRSGDGAGRGGGGKATARAGRGGARRWLGTALAVGGLGLGVAAATLGLLGGRPGLDGQVVWEGETSVGQIGPEGWYLASDDGDQRMRNGITGESYELTFGLVDRITPGGGYVEAGVDELRIHRRGGEEVAVIPFARLGEDVDGLDGLVVGDDLGVVAMSEQTVVVATCYAAEATSINDGGAGSRVVVSAWSLTDGARRWARDTGAACAGSDVVARTAPGMEATRHLLVREGDGRTRALRVEDGVVRGSWADAPFGRVVVQGDLAAARAGDVVTVTDLEVQEEVARVRCGGARLLNPGGFTDQLSTYATVAVTCADQRSYVLAPQTRAAVAVEAGALDGQQIPDGRPVLHDRAVLTRTGGQLRLTDALDGREIATREVPSDFRVATNDPRGRLLRLYRSQDARDGGVDTEHLAVDLRTGTWVVEDSRRLSPGGDVSPQGLILLSAGGEPARGSGRSYRGEVEPRTWLLAPADVAPAR